MSRKELELFSRSGRVVHLLVLSFLSPGGSSVQVGVLQARLLGVGAHLGALGWTALRPELIGGALEFVGTNFYIMTVTYLHFLLTSRSFCH